MHILVGMSLSIGTSITFTVDCRWEMTGNGALVLVYSGNLTPKGLKSEGKCLLYTNLGTLTPCGLNAECN